MHRGAVQHITPIFNTQKASGLLEGLGANPTDVEKVLPAGKTAMLVAMRHQVASLAHVEARNVLEQFCRGRIDIDPDPVHTGLYRFCQT